MTRHPQRAWQAVIVDLDGTLVDTLGDFEHALARTLAELGHAPVSRDFIARTVGKGSEHLIRCTLGEVGASDGAFDAACAAYQRHYAEVNGRHSTVFDGVVEGLTRLQARGLPMACLTNKPGAFARALLQAKGLAPCFSRVFGGDAFERRKPDPLPLLETCRALGSEPARTLMVGDSGNDAAAARAAGCPVVLLRHGYNHGQPAEAAGADAVLDSLAEVPAWMGLAPRA